MFKPLQFLGSEKEISKIVESTISTLKREYKLKVSQDVIVPVIVDCFIESAMYESLKMLGIENVRSEINLFEMLRFVHEIVPGDENPELLSIVTLGRMGMRKLELEMPEDENDMNSTEKISDIDIKLLETISIRACDYIAERHGLHIKDYEIVFKVAEVFFNEMVSYVKVNQITDNTLTVFDQFSILLDDNGMFESIEISEYLQNTINVIHDQMMQEAIRLQQEDDEFAENRTK
jgi:histidyl-tRNA synthetase